MMPEVEKQLTAAEEAELEVKPGGLSFEVILEDAKTTELPEIKTPPTPTASLPDIESKLKVIKTTFTFIVKILLSPPLSSYI